MRKVLIPGLVFYGLLSGMGLFLGSGLSSPLLIPWLAGYLFLVFTLSYFSLFSRNQFNSFPFIVLGIIGLNFFVQVTGGAASPLRSGYFLLAAAATFQPILRAYVVPAIILALDAANLLIAGQALSGRWPAYAGFALSLMGMVFIITPVTGRIQSQARVARERYRKLIADANAVDPLASGMRLSTLAENNRQAANVSSAVEREGAFKGLIDMIYGLVPAHTYAFFVTDRDDGVFTLRAIRSESRYIPPVSTVQVSRGSGLIGICIDKNQQQYLPDLVIPSRSLGYYTQDVPIKSFLATPVHQGEKIVGVLILDSLEDDAFSPDTQDLLSRFAPFFSQIIEKIRISHELDLRAKNSASLHEMSAILNSSLELTDVLGRLTDKMRIVAPYDFCAFILYQEESGEMVVAAQRGYDHRVAGKSFPLGESIILKQMFERWKTSSSEPYDFPDLGRRGRDIELFPIKELQQPVQSLYCLPLVAREKFIGACILGSLRSNAFTRYHKDFIDTLMNQVSVVIDNAMLHSRIRDLAHTDGLTGLLNHRTFMDKLDEEFRRLDRDYRPFSLLLLDIDFFKKINDEFGHPVGDTALKGVADIIRKTARTVDFVARYGGEEFAVGMVGADSKGAAQTAERIRRTVEQTVIIEKKIELSIGVATFTRGDSKKDLIAHADEALYYAKRTGRNRVSLYDDIDDRDALAIPKQL